MDSQTPDDRLKKENWEVHPVSIETAICLVKEHHYAHGASKTAVCLHGLFPARAFWESDCKGVAWWIPPTKSAARATYPNNWQGVLSLSRFVIVPGVPKNACSFLLSRSMKLIDRRRWPCLVTYADVAQGHKGTIYKACNWTYVGMTAKEPTWKLGGRQVSRKAGPKTRTKLQMEALGAVMVGRSAKHKYVHIQGRRVVQGEEGR